MFRDVPGCSGMFWDVPECSGVFHVPGFIEALLFLRELDFVVARNINILWERFPVIGPIGIFSPGTDSNAKIVRSKTAKIISSTRPVACLKSGPVPARMIRGARLRPWHVNRISRWNKSSRVWNPFLTPHRVAINNDDDNLFIYLPRIANSWQGHRNRFADQVFYRSYILRYIRLPSFALFKCQFITHFWGRRSLKFYRSDMLFIFAWFCPCI